MLKSAGSVNGSNPFLIFVRTGTTARRNHSPLEGRKTFFRWEFDEVAE
jgi:hypothetical protein